ncbi:PilZ domain-containing protein [Clostridium sp. LBM24168]
MRRNDYSYLSRRNQIFKMDRRINERFGYSSKFKIASANSEKLNVEVLGVDLSISGIGFISSKKFEIDDILEVTFKHNNITIPAIVKVNHVDLYDYGYFIGGQFIAIQNIYRDMLKQDLS